MTHVRKAIGVLGGMGPEASEYLYKMLIRLAIDDYGADSNESFPEIVLHSVPVPDFISSDKKQATVRDMLCERVEKLNQLDLSCLSIACNTVHVLLPALQAVSRVPFVSMIEEVANRVAEDGKKKVIILGTPSTIRYGLYQKALEARGIGSVVPEPKHTDTLESVIRSVIAGTPGQTEAERLVAVADELRVQGAEGVILGCTELPLAFPENYDLTVYNSVKILASALLQRYYRGETSEKGSVHATSAVG